MSVDAGKQPTVIGQWMRRRLAVLRLLRDDNYRRDGMKLLFTNLRSHLTARTIVGFVAIAVVGVFGILRFVDSPELGWQVISGAFVLAAAMAGATILSGEQRSGTLELVWLATGSERGLLRLRIGTVMVLLGVLMVPTVIFASAFFGADFSAGGALVFLLVNSWLILTLMVYIETFLPQTWAGGLIGAAAVIGLWVSLRTSSHPLNPFLSPVRPPDPNALGMNRFFMVVAGFLFFRGAARRLRSIF